MQPSFVEQDFQFRLFCAARVSQPIRANFLFSVWSSHLSFFFQKWLSLNCNVAVSHLPPLSPVRLVFRALLFRYDLFRLPDVFDHMSPPQQTIYDVFFSSLFKLVPLADYPPHSALMLARGAFGVCVVCFSVPHLDSSFPETASVL